MNTKFALAQRTANAFCPTGEGGGIDPSCSPAASHGGSKKIWDEKGNSLSGGPSRDAVKSQFVDKELANKLTDEELDAVDKYRSYWFPEINGTLRGQKVHPDDRDLGKKGVAEVSKHLDSAFAKASPTTDDITVYRGMDDGVAGKIDKAFMSTSLDKSVADEFGGTNAVQKTVKITIPKGTRVLAFRTAEKEILLPRGGKLVAGDDGYVYENHMHVTNKYALGRRLAIFNAKTKHHPAGSSRGGQFMSGDASGGKATAHAEAVAKAEVDVLAERKKTNKEAARVIDKDGNVTSGHNATHSSISVGDMSDSGVTVVHSHPKPQSLSSDDIFVASQTRGPIIAVCDESK